MNAKHRRLIGFASILAAFLFWFGWFGGGYSPEPGINGICTKTSAWNGVELAVIPDGRTQAVIADEETGQLFTLFTPHCSDHIRSYRFIAIEGEHERFPGGGTFPLVPLDGALVRPVVANLSIPSSLMDDHYDEEDYAIVAAVEVVNPNILLVTYIPVVLLAFGVAVWRRPEPKKVAATTGTALFAVWLGTVLAPWFLFMPIFFLASLVALMMGPRQSTAYWFTLTSLLALLAGSIYATMWATYGPFGP